MSDLARLGIMVDSTGIASATSRFREFVGAGRDVEAGANRMMSTFDKLGQSLMHINQAWDLISKVGKIAWAGLMIGTAAETTQVQLEVLLKSQEKAIHLYGEWKNLAAKTPLETEDITQAGKSLIAFGESASTVTDTVRRLGDVSSGIGAPLNEIAQIYGKARVQGKLFSEDMNQFAGRGIPIFTTLAQVMGVAPEEIKKLGAEGKITFPLLEQSFKLMTDQGGRFSGMMERMSQTTEGKLSTMIDAFKLSVQSLATQLLPTIKDIVEALTGLFDWLSKIPGGVLAGAAAFATIIAIGPTFVTTLTAVKLALGGLAGVFTGPLGIIALVVGASMAILGMISAYDQAKLAAEKYQDTLNRGELYKSTIGTQGARKELEEAQQAMSAVEAKIQEIQASPKFANFGTQFQDVGFKAEYNALLDHRIKLIQIQKELNPLVEAQSKTEATLAKAIAEKAAAEVASTAAAAAVQKNLTESIKEYEIARKAVSINHDSGRLSNIQALEEELNLMNGLSDQLVNLQAAGSTDPKIAEWLKTLSDESKLTDEKLKKLKETMDLFKPPFMLNANFGVSLTTGTKGLISKAETDKADELVEAFKKIGDQLKNIMEQGAVDAFKDMGYALATGGNVGDAFANSMAKIGLQILDQLPLMFLQAGLKLIIDGNWPVGLAFVAASGLFAFTAGYTHGAIDKKNADAAAQANALGNIYGPAGRTNFALGGIVDKPTYFRFAQGAGLMGEAGEEGILPLKRMSNGALGVRASGTTGEAPVVQVNIINNSGEKVEQRETEGPDGRILEVIIGSVVQTMVGTGKLDQSLKSRYGLRYGGINRS